MAGPAGCSSKALVSSGPLRLALDAIGELADDEIDLADAALQLARVGEPDANWRVARDRLTLLARECASMRDAARTLDARAQALSELMARHGFTGDGDTYDDLDNANLIRVIARRRGLPVALGILWLHAARAAGWAIRGVNFPGHFLVALETTEGLLALDVFAGGRALGVVQLRAMLRRVHGDKAEPGPGLLDAMTNRDILLRLQANIRSRLLVLGQLGAACECTRDMLRIAPGAAQLWQEAALLHQRLDQTPEALDCYARFLRLVPGGPAAARARRRMAELRGRLN